MTDSIDQIEYYPHIPECETGAEFYTTNNISDERSGFGVKPDAQSCADDQTTKTKIPHKISEVIAYDDSGSYVAAYKVIQGLPEKTIFPGRAREDAAKLNQLVGDNRYATNQISRSLFGWSFLDRLWPDLYQVVETHSAIAQK